MNASSPRCLGPLLLVLLAGPSLAQRHPTPAECLTPGCSKLTLLYSLGGTGMGIANATRGKTSYQFQDRSAPIAKGADAAGYVVFPPQLQQKLAGNCYDASQHPTADQMELLRGIVAQLRQNYYTVPTFYWTVIDEAPRANCLNSSATAELRTVFFYSVMGRALRWDRDAIASVMAHEKGHIVDKYCTSSGQNITPGFYQTPLGQICEKHADNIGIQYAVGAGFNPTGFVTTFQTLQKYGPTSKDLRYTSNHPINQDRITNVGLALETLCNRNIPRACEYLNPAASQAARTAPSNQQRVAQSLTGQFGGIVHNQTGGLSAEFGIIVRDDEGALSGCMEVRRPLFGSGPLTGFAGGPDVSFVVTSAFGKITFLGHIRNGAIDGTYTVEREGAPDQVGTFTLRQLKQDEIGFDTTKCPTDVEMNK